VAYFYSEKQDSWVQYDDKNLSKIGNFQNVIDRCVKGRQQPVLLFFERESFLKAHQKSYFNLDTMSGTNFWKGKEAKPFNL